MILRAQFPIPATLLLLLTVFLGSAVAEIPKFKAGERIKGGEFKSAFYFNIADFNYDGKKDVIILEGGRQVFCAYINLGTDAAPRFGFAQQVICNMTETVPQAFGSASSIHFTDWDDDGDLDLLGCESENGKGLIQVKNTGTQAAYDYTNGILMGVAGYASWSNYNDMVFIADWDHDGVKDAILADVHRPTEDSPASLFTRLIWHRNTGTHAAPVFVPDTLRVAAGTQIYAPHPVVTDWNNDGHPDVVTAGEFEKGPNFIGNYSVRDGKVRIFYGTAVIDSLHGPYVLDSVTGGVQPWVCDWNNDAKKDLAVMDTLCVLRVYLNRGTDAAPAFASAADTVTANDFAYAGIRTAQLVDWDRDDRPDLVLGGSYNQRCSQVYARVRIYPNGSADREPLYRFGTFFRCNGTIIRTNWGYTGRTSPWIDDLNGDGNWDMLMGVVYAATNDCFLYTGNAATQAGYDFASEANCSFGSTINTYKVPSSVQIVDYNNDGLKDIVWGKDGSSPYLGNVYCYQNAGTASAPLFDDAHRATILSLKGFTAAMSVYDLDNDGKKDLVSGRDDGRVDFFRNLGSDAAPLYHPDSSVLLKLEDASAITLPPAYPGTEIPGVTRTPMNSVPQVADYDGDGRPDLLLTVGYDTRKMSLKFGEFWLFRNSGGASRAHAAPSPEAQPVMTVAPNPFKPGAGVSVRGAEKAGTRVTVADAAGRVVATFFAGREGVHWNAPQLTGGFYLFRATGTDGRMMTTKAMVLK